MERFLAAGFVVYKFSPHSPQMQTTTNLKGKSHQARPCLLFSHATGIAAQTYATLFQAWADLWNIDVFAYDMRGHGLTELPLFPAYAQGKKSIHRVLVEDVCALFWELKSKNNSESSWFLGGHSLGGWLSLFAASQCHIKQVVLFDISLLPKSQAAFWTAACLFAQRQLHFLSAAARRRKRRFGSRDEALKVFSRSAFFRGWKKHLIENYVDANYERDGNFWVLRCDPDWEADIFEAQPASLTWTMLQIQKKVRENLKVTLISGEDSLVCHTEGWQNFHRFFPQSRNLVLPHCGHMFPFEAQRSLLNLLQSENPFLTEKVAPVEKGGPADHSTHEDVQSNAAPDAVVVKADLAREPLAS